MGVNLGTGYFLACVVGGGGGGLRCNFIITKKTFWTFLNKLSVQ